MKLSALIWVLFTPLIAADAVAQSNPFNSSTTAHLSKPIGATVIVFV